MQTTTSNPSRTLRIPANRRPAPTSGFLANLRLAGMTAAFTAFSAGIFLASWEIISLFQNGSYKLATGFVGCIIVSNAASKYALWCQDQ